MNFFAAYDNPLNLASHINLWSVFSPYASKIEFLIHLLGLKEMGLECFISAPGARTPTVTTIKVPEGIDFKAVTGYAMEK